MSTGSRPIGIYYAYWTREWDVDFLPFIRKAQSLGFDILEINGGAVVALSSAERKHLRDEAAARNIALTFGIGLPPHYDVSSQDERVRQAGVQFMKDMVAAVAECGGEMIGGTVHSYWPATPPRDLEEKRRIRNQGIKSMKEVLPVAADLGVTLNVEVINRFEQFLLNTAAEAVSFVDEIDMPNCGVLLDTFHMNIEEDSFLGALKTVGPRLKSFHVGEANRKPPGMGRLPWEEIRQGLDAIDFHGPVVMEPFVTPGGTVGRDIGIWREIMPEENLDDAVSRSVAFLQRVLR